MITLRNRRRRRGAPMARHANRAGLPRRPLPVWFDTRDLPAVPMRWEDLGKPAPVLTDKQAAELRRQLQAGVRVALLVAHARRVVVHVRQLLVDAIERELVRR